MPGLTLEAFPAAERDPMPSGGVVVSAAEPEVLLGILRPEVNLAIWHRDLPGSVTAPLRRLAATPFAAVAEAEVEAAMGALEQRLPEATPLDLLLDIRMLATIFAALARTGGAARIRLEAIQDAACHLWHADAVGLRLLCTYRGPATEWLPLGGGARRARRLDPDRPPCAPERLPTGAVAILKGEGHPGNAGGGCIHRSPPAGPGDQARLLLCLDEPGRIPTT